MYRMNKVLTWLVLAALLVSAFQPVVAQSQQMALIDFPNAFVVSNTDPRGSSFAAEASSTANPYFGTHGTYFADVTGDGKADAIVINVIKDGLVSYIRITVRRSDGAGFRPNETWLQDLWPSGTSFFADVTGDGRADWILVKPTKVVVRHSTGTQFGAEADWTSIHVNKLHVNKLDEGIDWSWKYKRTDFRDGALVAESANWVVAALTKADWERSMVGRDGKPAPIAV
ncbi:MAG: hypothetical protein KJZ93_25790, partial [Caldilineaceae bacterium]|nr:hypothetical protein [Caldilineaceae bacterium]